MRATHARISSAERALASDSIGSSWVTLVRLETGAEPTRWVGESGVTSSGCSASSALSSSNSASYSSSAISGSSRTW